MPLPSWLAKQPSARAPDAWVGVQLNAQQLLAVRATSAGASGRPRVHACHLGNVATDLPALRAWWERGASRRRDACALLLGAGDYQILHIDAPAVEPTEYRDAARWQIKDLIDFPVEDAALDCLRLPGDPTGSAAAKLITVVTRRALVQETVTQWRAAGLALKVIDIPEMALRNLAVLATGAGACAFLHVGVDAAHLVLLWQEELCVSRQLGMGGAQLRSLDDWNRNAQIERLALEIQRTVDAFGRQFSAANLAQLWVSSVHDAAGVAQALGMQLSIQVQPFVHADWIDFDAGAQPFDLANRVDHTLAIGAALRGEQPRMKQQLNLIDPRLLPVAARPSVAALLALLAAVGLAVLGHYSWERTRFIDALAQLGTEQAAEPDDAVPDPTLEALQRQVERDELLRDGLARAADLPADSVGQLRQVAAALPDTLWLSEVELSGRNGLRISGGALDVTALATYAARLGAIASLKGRPLQALTVEPHRPEATGEADSAFATTLPPHHLFVLANGDALVSDRDTR